MTVPQYTAFLVWYKTGIEGKSRSHIKTAKLTRHALVTIVAWSEDFGWEEMAREKDAEIVAGLEELFVSSILDEKKAVLKRQRTIMAKIYKKIYKAVDAMEIKFPDVIKLLEYEASLSGAGASRVGENFYVLLKHLPSEKRSGILSRYRELRDTGGVLGDRVGSIGAVADPTRN
jgi:hypothetical protein